MFSTRLTKRQYIICFQKNLPITLYQIFWKKMQFRRIDPKKQHHVCHIFSSHVSQLASLMQMCCNSLPSFCVPDKNKSQLQKHSGNYFLSLEMYSNQENKFYPVLQNFKIPLQFPLTWNGPSKYAEKVARKQILLLA